MKTKTKLLSLIIIILLLFPTLALSSTPTIFTGTVTGIRGNQIVFVSSSAAKYSADTGNALLVRKNGAAMELSEILVGDKIQVQGRLWADNSRLVP